MRILLTILIICLTVDSYSQDVFGEYYNKQNPITKLIIFPDSTFSYYDWVNGSCYAQVIKSGFINIKGNTLVLYATQSCSHCYNITTKNFRDTSKILIEFDSRLVKMFPDLKISYDFNLEKQFTLDNNNRIIHDLINEGDILIPFIINIRSKYFSTDIDLGFDFKLKFNRERTINDNFIILGLNTDYIELFKQESSLLAKFSVSKNAELRLISNFNSMIVPELIKK